MMLVGIRRQLFIRCLYLFVKLIFLSHYVICIFLLLAEKYLRTFDVICVDFLRCANKECECSYQNAKYYNLNGFFLIIWYILKFWGRTEYPLILYIHPSKFNISSVYPFNVHHKGTLAEWAQAWCREVRVVYLSK